VKTSFRLDALAAKNIVRSVERPPIGVYEDVIELQRFHKELRDANMNNGNGRWFLAMLLLQAVVMHATTRSADGAHQEWLNAKD
jgi:hypothetical protein